MRRVGAEVCCVLAVKDKWLRVVVVVAVVAVVVVVVIVLVVVCSRSRQT